MTEKYCPDWVFDATVSEVAMQFLLRDYPLSQIAQKHAQGLSKLYLPIEITELLSGAELLLSFLSEINANEEAVNHLSGFSYFRVNYKSNKTRRKLNSSLFAVDAGSNLRDYNVTKTLKSLSCLCARNSSRCGYASKPWMVIITYARTATYRGYLKKLDRRNELRNQRVFSLTFY